MKLSGLAWSRSTLPEIPLTDPVLLYCQMPQSLQSAGSGEGLGMLANWAIHSGPFPSAVLLPVQVASQSAVL